MDDREATIQQMTAILAALGEKERAVVQIVMDAAFSGQPVSVNAQIAALRPFDEYGTLLAISELTRLMGGRAQA